MLPKGFHGSLSNLTGVEILEEGGEQRGRGNHAEGGV
jgi:hypothetical protein